MGNFVSILKSPFRNALQGANKIRSFIPIYGLRGTFDLIIKNVVWFETVCRLDKDLSTSEPRVEPKVPLRIVRYSRDDIFLENWEDRERIIQIRGEYGLTQFQKRLDRGDLAFLAYWLDKFVGFIWLEFPPGEDVGYPLLEDEAYTFDGWTFEEYRGNRALPVLQQAVMDEMRKNWPDIHTLVTHIATWNKPSLSGDQRAGYKITRLELSIVLLGFHRKLSLDRPVPKELVKNY